MHDISSKCWTIDQSLQICFYIKAIIHLYLVTFQCVETEKKWNKCIFTHTYTHTIGVKEKEIHAWLNVAHAFDWRSNQNHELLWLSWKEKLLEIQTSRFTSMENYQRVLTYLNMNWACFETFVVFFFFLSSKCWNALSSCYSGYLTHDTHATTLIHSQTVKIVLFLFYAYAYAYNYITYLTQSKEWITYS